MLRPILKVDVIAERRLLPVKCGDVFTKSRPKVTSTRLSELPQSEQHVFALKLNGIRGRMKATISDESVWQLDAEFDDFTLVHGSLKVLIPSRIWWIMTANLAPVKTIEFFVERLDAPCKTITIFDVQMVNNSTLRRVNITGILQDYLFHHLEPFIRQNEVRWRHPFETYRLNCQTYYTTINSVVEERKHVLPLMCDGIIAHNTTNDKIHRWKEIFSSDLRFDKTDDVFNYVFVDGGGVCYLLASTIVQHFAEPLTVGHIYEVLVDPEERVTDIFRVRNDKRFPNSTRAIHHNIRLMHPITY